jgi:prophage regulatory protein
MTRYLRQPEVLSRVGVSWITLRRWERDGHFPKRRRLGRNSIGWVEGEIEEWCASRAAAHGAEAA